MSDTKFVKCDVNEILKRYTQVHTITLSCPLNDDAIREFHIDCLLYLTAYSKGNGVDYKEIPVIDIFGVFVNCMTNCKLKGIDTKYLTVIGSIIRVFDNLKYVTISFIEEENDLLSSYDLLMVGDGDTKAKNLTNVCRIDVLQMVLSDMFTQLVVDMLNKVMILNDVMSNSYLERSFVVYFDFDDYTSFINMFLENNFESLNILDTGIIECLNKFPPVILKNKPIIKIVTNYEGI